MVQIELRQVDPLGRTVIVCREGSAMLNNGELEGCEELDADRVIPGLSSFPLLIESLWTILLVSARWTRKLKIVIVCAACRAGTRYGLPLHDVCMFFRFAMRYTLTIGDELFPKNPENGREQSTIH